MEHDQGLGALFWQQAHLPHLLTSLRWALGLLFAEPAQVLLQHLTPAGERQGGLRQVYVPH